MNSTDSIPPSTGHQRPAPLPEFRGLFGEKGDSPTWLEATAAFPNGVPRFESRADCLDFMIKYNTYNGGSNPHSPQLMHIFTMLTSWDQIEKVLIPNIEKARTEPSFAKPVSRDYLNGQNEDDNGGEANGTDTRTNVYELPSTKAVSDEIDFRLSLPIHRATTPSSTINTLKYLFFHMRCGIFVMIRDGKLRIFCPFVNPDYLNTWGDKLTLEGDGTLDSYYTAKSGQYRDENIEKNKFKWWANGNIICNEFSRPEDKGTLQHWGDHFLSPLRDMLGEACRTRSISDCEFFLNKRDYPQLKINIPRGGIPVEPYGFIFDKDDRYPDQDVDLDPSHRYETYAPIVSFYAAKKDRFADLPWPSSEDWEAACGLVFPNTFIHKKPKGSKAEKDEEGNIKPVFDSNPRDLFTEANFRKFERSWEDNRVATAFFRGTATGGGTTIDNNQRLKVAHYSHEWKNDEEKGGEEPFLDAAIVGWNMRDKKVANTPMTFLRKKNFNFTAGKHHFTPIYEQSKYKYLVYVDGHCAACRYGFMLRLGSVILKVDPRQVADTMWYFPLLQPYVDHVPVKSDLSDLEEKIRWCRNNDAKCKEIGENAKKFYEKYVGKDALLDYVEMVCKHISKRYVKPPKWWSNPPPVQDPPLLRRKPDGPCYRDRDTSESRFCVRCQADADKEEEELKKEKAAKKAANEGNKKSKLSFRERMKRKAEENKKAAAKRKKA